VHVLFAGLLERGKGELEKALQIQEPLYRDHPREIAFALNVARTYADMGNGLREGNQLEPALPWYDRNVSVLEGVLQKEPQHTEARMLLSTTHGNRAETIIRLGRRTEAIQDWRRMAELGERQQHSELRGNRALGLAQLGDHRRATEEVKAMEATGLEGQQSVYNFVCVYALSLRAVRNDSGLSPTERNALAEEYGAHAVGLLAKMRSAGFFKSRGLVDYLKRDTDMEPLHQRADFQALVREMEQETGPSGK
jgi:tetratricopeptide (TPR) repeat protein